VSSFILVVASVAASVALLSSTAAGQRAAAQRKQDKPPQQGRLDAVDHAERMARIALTGDLGFPPLPPVYADSPRDELLYADRFPVDSGSEQATPGDGGGPVVLSGWIPPGAAGTGTAIGESFRYQVPVPYDAFGPPLPMVIAYHGYGASAGSVHPATTIDEEANARGWFYFAPTGLDDQLFGTPPCQQNVDAALQWMLDHFNIDRDRLYMVGFSLGGGVAANYVAQHRDPVRTMFAALGIVSGTYVWVQTCNSGTSGLKARMEYPCNFGGNPVA
jgi:predicted esterase